MEHPFSLVLPVMFSQRATLDPADGWKSIFKRANGEVWDADWQMYYRRLGESVYALFMVVHWRDELEEASEVYDGIMFQAPLRTDGGAPVVWSIFFLKKKTLTLFFFPSCQFLPRNWMAVWCWK